MDRGSTSSAAADSGTCSAATAAAAYRRGVLNSSCKRRRLASKDEEDNGEAPTYSFIGSPRKLNYEKNESETSDDSEDDDSINRDILQVRQESILRRLLRLNYEDGENHLLHTTSFAKLFEYVKDYDIVAERKTSDVALSWSEDDSKSDSTAEGVWKHRGSGYVKFIKCLQEGYNCGMIRMELTKNGTLETLMCHELTREEVLPMPSKKGKAYTWRCKDWAYRTATRTFAIRFDNNMDAIKWKEQLEQSKISNCRVRSGLDVPDLLDDVCFNLKNLSTVSG